MKVYKAIAAVQGEMAVNGISKNKKNQQQGYSFRGIDDIYNALAPLLSANGLCILPRVINRTVTEQQSKSGGMLFYTVVDVEFDLVSAEDDSKHTIRVCGEAMDSGDKATNKAMSAAYKYACLQTFCIPTEGDNDADAKTHEIAAKPKPEPTRATPPIEEKPKQVLLGVAGPAVLSGFVINSKGTMAKLSMEEGIEVYSDEVKKFGDLEKHFNSGKKVKMQFDKSNERMKMLLEIKEVE